MLQVRVMPNMPCLIRQAASAFVMGNSTNQQDLQRVIMLLSAVGEASQKHPAALSPHEVRRPRCEGRMPTPGQPSLSTALATAQ